MGKEKIIELIEDKLTDIEISNNLPRYSDDYYMKNDAKIEVLEEILREIENLELEKITLPKVDENKVKYLNEGVEPKNK